jgi:sugar/nucleoside kinase (ribokinase family)
MVLCVGAAAYDLFFPLAGWLEENRKYEIASSRESGGGPAANAAYLLSRWGVGAALACVLGDDLYGRRIREEFREAGTDLRLTETRAGAATPLSVILVNTANGSRTLVNRLAPAEPLRFGPEALESLAALRPEVLLFDGHQPEAALQAMSLFPEARTILDAGSRRRGTELLATRVEFLAPSEAFARAMTGEQDLDSEAGRRRCLHALAALNRREVVVTLGERGVLYLEKGEVRHLPAFRVRAVDTTGAGDVFHGAFAYAVLQGWALAETVRFAAMAAALSVTRPGARASIPALAEVRAALSATAASAG